MKSSWSPREIRTFLDQHARGRIAEDIAEDLDRSVPAVQSMRRKLKRLQGLGARPDQLPQLLQVSEPFVLASSLPEIVRCAKLGLTRVNHFIRRDRTSGKAVLVSGHQRNRVRPAR